MIGLSTSRFLNRKSFVHVKYSLRYSFKAKTVECTNKTLQEK